MQRARTPSDKIVRPRERSDARYQLETKTRSLPTSALRFSTPSPSAQRGRVRARDGCASSLGAGCVVLSSDGVAIRQILCAIDLSEISAFALTYAVEFARTAGAKVTALHVVQTPPGVFLEETGMDYSPAGLSKKEESTLRDLIRRSAQGDEMAVTIVSGHPALQIVEQAQRIGADLIVIGTHGRTGFRHMLLGSVAERVLRLSPVPVLTLRKPEAAQPK